MPPKKVQVQKIVEDKTFGMKNKNKSAKAAKYMQQLEAQASNFGGRAARDAEKRKQEQMAKKKAEEDKKAAIAELFKPIQVQQKVAFGVDPKTVLCQFFKAGTCQKGNKCKFSHDLDVEKKAQRIDLYTDLRSGKKEGEKQETMDDWEQEKLESVVNSRHGNQNKNRPTEIVCKYFLEAIENRKYGWFWICPNGDSCKYRHALPPGFVLKKKETEEERRAREEAEKENEISLEEFLDTERFNLGSNLTPITYDSFMKWKEDRKAKQAAEEEQTKAKKAEEYKKMKSSGKSGQSFSGRELFDFNPDWATGGDDDEGAMDVYEREEQDEEEPQAPAQPADAEQSTENVAIDEELFEDLDGLDIDDEDDDDE